MRPRGDAGSASVEFVVLAVVLLVPLVYLVVVLGRVQAGAFATAAAARSAARAWVDAPDAGAAADRAAQAVGLALADQGFAPGDAVVATRCSADPCLSPASVVTVDVALDVELPGVPSLLSASVPLRVPVEASAVGVVDRFTDRGASAAAAGGAP